MKRFITLCCCTLSIACYAQLPASVVTAPALEARADVQTGILTGLQGSLQVLEQTEKKVEEIKSRADWINQLRSLQDFITLMETIACMVRGLDVNLNSYNTLIGPRASCYLDFHYQININKLRKSVDIINLVISDGFSMDRGQRMDAYEIAFQNFIQSQADLHALDNLIRRKIKQYKRDEDYSSSLKKLYSDRLTSR